MACSECTVDQVIDRSAHLNVIGLASDVHGTRDAGPGRIFADGDFGICVPVEA